MPLPAKQFGYARWYDENKIEHDRFLICTRHVPLATLLAAANSQRDKLRCATFAVTKQLEWCLAQANDEYFVAPTKACSLGNGLVLLVFADATANTLFRVINVSANSIIYEETATSLCERLQLIVPAYAKDSINEVVVMASGSNHIHVALATQLLVLKFETSQLVMANKLIPTSGDFVFSQTRLLQTNYHDPTCKIRSLDSGMDIAIYQPKYNKNAYRPIAAASGTERFAMAHQGGMVEIIDDGGNLLQLLRPFPRASNTTQLHIALSHTGKFLLAQESDTSAMIDLKQGLIANFDFPKIVNEYSPATFTPEINYFPDLIIGDEGVFILSQKEIMHFSIRELIWRPIIQPGKSARGTTGTQQQSSLTTALKIFHKPSLELTPIKAGDANVHTNSFMYGLPSLLDQQAWPIHAGQPMLLLCQLDLREAALLLPENPFPDKGFLLFFVSVDKDYEVLLDEEFNPVATRVLWINQTAGMASNEYTDMPYLDSQPVTLIKGAATWPQTDAAIVEGQLFSDMELEEYRSFLEKHQPESACGNTHRLGGYPDILQNNDREADAEYRRNGHYPKPDRNGWKAAKKWRLLLQLNSDDNFMWGTDSGILYFMIHDDDLSIMDFSPVISTAVGF
ncbi:DUF1963 domain-containing protein [Undibacterium sp. Tian12W]|uniref:DUF1963 domain-containing protein n=1 Tax=Undibacterium sp. Tian12W TaxID=3413054 RepID=UPI003BF3B3C1